MQCKVTNNKISDQKILATMLLELVVYISYIFGVKNVINMRFARHDEKGHIFQEGRENIWGE